MTGHAVPALILITCDGRRGQWVSLHALATRLGVRADHIKREADALVDQGQLCFATHAGHPYWGVGVEGLLPQPPSPNQSNPENTHD